MDPIVRVETIVAPATPPGEGGVAVIRLSGARAEEFLLRLFRPSARGLTYLESHRLYHGRIETGSGELVDEVLAVIMRGPRSFTREDVAEVHCHGGPQIVRRLLDSFIDVGARLARPGEFSLRAFLNGRIDLSQAEAIIDVIRASSEAASRVAVRQLDGQLSRFIRSLREELVDHLALVEAHIDFPDEDLELPQRAQLQRGVEGSLAAIDRLLGRFETGRSLREGLAVLILGRPNVGKSSLLNALIGEARAIVTDIPGTTRDTIEENLVLGGFPLQLIDTAGIRATNDVVEEEGVRRAKNKAASADLVLLVIDGSCELGAEDLQALDICTHERTLLVVNKADLAPAAPLPLPFSDLASVRVSAQHGIGIDDLINLIVRRVTGGVGVEQFDTIMVSDRRHREVLLGARVCLLRFLDGLAGGFAPELLAIELRESLHRLGEITGETTPDDVLDRIFSRFCIGK